MTTALLSCETYGQRVVRAARCCSLALLLVFNAAIVASGDALVVWSYSGQVGTSVTGAVTNFSDVQVVQAISDDESAGVTKTVAVSGHGVTGEATFFALALPGYLSVKNEGALFSETPLTGGLFKTDVKASWSDAIMVNSTKPPGTQVKFVSRIALTGSLTTVATGSGPPAPSTPLTFRKGDASATVKLEGTGVSTPPHPNGFFAASLRCEGGCTVGSSDLPAPQFVTITRTVNVGEPFFLNLSMTLHGEAGLFHADSAGGGAGGAWVGDYSRTLRWDGITSMEDAVTGEPITDWSITSKSGFDYSRPFPVPEPSSLALITGVAAGLALRRGSRR